MAAGKSIVKYIYKAHVYAGIFITLHIVIFSITGLFLLFKDQFQTSPQKTETSSLSEKSIDEKSQLYNSILQKVMLAHPQDRPLAFFPDDHDENIMNVRLGRDGATQLRGASRSLFHLSSSEPIVEKKTTANDFFDWMLILHRELFLGSNGKLYIGLVGIVYIFMLLSGFYLYGKFMKTKYLGAIRKNGLPKMIDLHKFFGVITFGWSLIVGISGVFLAFNGVLIKLFQFQSLRYLTEQYQKFANSDLGTVSAKNYENFQNVVATALAAKPESVISYISFPNSEFGIPGHYLFLVNGTTAITKRLSDLVVVNANTAQLTEVIQLPLYLKIVLLSEPLHFGDYGGWPLKVIWGLFTLCSLAVALFGVISFFMKRKQKSDNPAQTSAEKIKQEPPMETWRASTYGLVTVLAALVILALVIALFSEGLITYLAVGILCLPLLMIFFGRRNYE